MDVQVAMPLAHDIAENARPKTDEFIENVMRPAVQDLINILEKQADEMSKKVQNVPISSVLCSRFAIHCSWGLLRSIVRCIDYALAAMIIILRTSDTPA